MIRATPDVLSIGANKDKKRTISARGRNYIRWVVVGGYVEPSFLSTLGPTMVEEILAEESGQARIRRLFTMLAPGTPVPRQAVATLAQQDDPMRRTRADQSDRLPGLKILSSHYKVNREALLLLGYGEPPKGTFIAVPRIRLRELPPALRAKLETA